MGWDGITLTPLGSDRDPQTAVDLLVDAYIEFGDDGPPVIHPGVATTTTSPLDADDTWLTSVVAVLRRHNPKLEVVEERRDDATGQLTEVMLYEDDDPCDISVYRSSVNMQPTRNYDDPEGEDGRGFTRMWAYCQLLAAEFDCIAWDAD